MNYRDLQCLTAVVLLTATCSIYAEPLNYGLVSLNTTASMDISRDEMVLNLNIEQQGNHRDQVSKTVTQRLNQVLHLAHGHSDFNTMQTNRSVSPTSEYKNDKRIDTGWRDRASVQIRSKNLSALNRFAADVQQQAMISSIDYQVADDTLQQYENTLTQQALDQFKQRATVISHQLGGRNYKIVNINIGNSRSEHLSTPIIGLMSASRADDDMPVQDNAAGKTQLMLNISGQIQVY